MDRESLITTIKRNISISYNTSKIPIVLDKLENMGYIIKDIIGAGSNGAAFYLENSDNVLKITKDPNEANASNYIKGEKFTNIVNIYRVFTFKVLPGFYFIEQEQLKDDYENVLEGYLYKFNIDVILPGRQYPSDETYSYEIIGDKLSRLLKATDKLKVDNKKINYIELAEYIDEEGSQKFYLDMINASEELRDNNISFGDFHRGNIMVDKNGNYKIIDLGLSRSPKSKIEMLERKIFKLANIL